MTTRTSHPVPPNAVYVWRGFKAPGATYAEFASFLGSIFVPACALLQPRAGLRAYLPTMVPQDQKPPAVPDQTALMFWATPQAHDRANGAIAVRIYQQLHGSVYDMTHARVPEVPVALPPASGSGSDALTADQPYFLVDRPADWMLGYVDHLVGARRADLTPADFLVGAYRWASTFHSAPPAGVDAGLVCCGADYVVAWVHSHTRGRAFATALDELASLTTPVLRKQPAPLALRAGLWDAWPGLDLTKDASINIQFHRPSEAEASPHAVAPR